MSMPCAFSVASAGCARYVREATWTGSFLILPRFSTIATERANEDWFMMPIACVAYIIRLLISSICHVLCPRGGVRLVVHEEAHHERLPLDRDALVAARIHAVLCDRGEHLELVAAEPVRDLLPAQLGDRVQPARLPRQQGQSALVEDLRDADEV